MVDCGRYMRTLTYIWVSNRFCIVSASFTWGGRTGYPDRVLFGQEFASWAPSQFDSYVCPSEWEIGPKPRQSERIETWRANAPNMAKLFVSVYGSERLNERLLGADDVVNLQVSEPRKYNLSFIRG